jgi:hypothetical protein
MEAHRYVALCERAWLHWSRLALDYTTTDGFHQATFGTFNPSQAHHAQVAAQAETTCRTRSQLLAIVPENLPTPNGRGDWAARHVDSSTPMALKLAASIDQFEAVPSGQ